MKRRAFIPSVLAALVSAVLAPLVAVPQEPLKAMVITPRGKVGIGTLDPSALLAVDGDRLAASGRVSVKAGAIEVIGDHTRFRSEVAPGNVVWIGNQQGVVASVASDTKLFLEVPLASGAPSTTMEVAANLLWVRSATDAPQLVTTAAGRVGIGTAAPQRPLHVVGGTVPPLLVQGAPGNYAMIGLKGAKAIQDWQLQATDSQVNQFRIAYSQNNPLLTLDTDGLLRVKSVVQTSSRRYKEDIRPFADDVAKLLELEPRSFRWKGTDQEGFGYVAEEVDALGLTRLVGYDGEGRPDSVSYAQLGVYLVELAKQQAQAIEALREENRAIRELLCAERPEASFCR